jgi:hypothetical protein
VGKLLSIGTAVILTFGLVWSPFLILGPDACLQVIIQNYLIQTNDSSIFVLFANLENFWYLIFFLASRYGKLRSFP